MPTVRLASEIDLAGWREAARALRMRQVAPEEALWTVDPSGDLLGEAGRAPVTGGGARFTVPKAFLELADLVILHRSDERFALLYRLLWRLGREPELLHVEADPDVQKARLFARSVSLAAQKMKAFVRFRPVTDPHGAQTCVAWFEPAHRVTEVTAPFFARRFAGRCFSILTPDVCVHWDARSLVFTSGVDPADAPREDSLEDYWRNLRKATPIPQPIAHAEAHSDMAAQTPSTPSRRVVREVLRSNRDASYDGLAPQNLEEIEAGVQLCRRCDLYRDATQGVPGEGAGHARLMFVGEQPGDQEDLAGKPFVGPAGQMFDRALAEAGVPRNQTFVTNAVKHFKHELRGKRRLHKTPNTGEVIACRWWLDAERRIVRPRVIVALGATAALSVFGKPVAISKARQQALQLPDQAIGVVSYHPSYLLRVPDADAKAKAYAMFLEDLKFAWKLAA
jgi:probable DNA metabolism protein